MSIAFVSAPFHNVTRSAFCNRQFILRHPPAAHPLHHHIPATRPCTTTTTTTTKSPVRCSSSSSSSIPDKNDEDDDNNNKNNDDDDENVPPAVQNTASGTLDQDWRAFRARLVRDEVNNPSMSPILNFLNDDNLTSSIPPLEKLAAPNNDNNKNGHGSDPHTSSSSSSSVINQHKKKQGQEEEQEKNKVSSSAPAEEKSQLWAHPVSFIETGSLLISSPRHFSGSHACTFFAKTAILILHHSEDEGTIGVIINRPLSPHMKRIQENSKPSTTTTNTTMKTSTKTPQSTSSSQSKSKLQSQSQPKSPSSSQQQQQSNKQPTPFDFNTPSSSSSHSTKTTDDNTYSIDDLFACADPPVFLGGPVGLETLGVLHGDPTFGHVVTGAVRSAPFTQAFKRFQAGALPHARFFLGYSGWRKGQLQDEINNGIWLLCSACDDIVLRTWKTGIQLHKTVLPLMGDVYAQIANELDSNSDANTTSTNNNNSANTTKQQQQSPTSENENDDDDDDDVDNNVKDR